MEYRTGIDRLKKVLTISLWCAAAPAACAEGVDLTKNIQLQTDIRNRIGVAGFDCPKPFAYREVETNYRGRSYRVDCLSAGNEAQSFRILEQPGQPPRVERW